MSNTYNHLLFLTEKNIDDLMYGKDASIQGFYTKLPTKSENTDFTEVKENIAWYNVRFENKEKVVRNVIPKESVKIINEPVKEEEEEVEYEEVTDDEETES